MAYSKTVWDNDTVPDIDADNLNKIENGIYDLDIAVDVSQGEIDEGFQGQLDIFNMKETTSVSILGPIARGSLLNINLNPNIKYRASSKNLTYIDKPIFVQCKTGFQWGYSKADSAGTFINWNGWYSSAQMIPIAAGTYLRFQIKRQTEVSSEIANPFEFAEAVRMYNANGSLLSLLPEHIFHVDMEWEFGTINVDGTDGQSSAAIRTNHIDVLDATKLLGVISDTTFRWGWHFYDANGSQISGASEYLLRPGLISIPENTKTVRFNMTKTGTTITLADGAVLQIYMNEDLRKIILDSKEKLIYTDIDLEQISWEVGGIDANGQDVARTNILRSGFFDISTVDELRMIKNSPINGYGVHIYDVDLNSIYNDSAWRTANSTYTIPDNAKFVRFNMFKNNNPVDPLLYKSFELSVVKNYAKLCNILDDIDFESGANVAYGEKINLDVYNNKVWSCDISTFIDFNDSDYSDLSDYDLNLDQSMAIYGGYIFLLLNAGGIVVVDFETKQIVGKMTSSITDRNHHNSAQFSDIFYDSNDIFPLLFVARCGNTVSAGTYDTCLVYRIQLVNNEFSVTLIKEIKTDITTYGNSWAVDIHEKTISMVGYANGTYAVTENNPICFWKWEMPSKESILSESELVLHESDCINQAKIPFELLQAAHAFGGNVWITCHSQNKKWVYVIDLLKSQIISRIPSTNSAEIEGIEIYDSKIYISHRRDDTSNPLTILQIEV